MPTIAQIAGALESGSVRLRGRDVCVSAVSAAQSAALRRALPRPTPPPGPNPLRGSASGEVVLCEHDPDYQRRLSEWLAEIVTIEAAVSLGLTVDALALADVASGPTDKLQAWARAALAEVRSALTEFEIRAVAREAARVGGEAAVEDARKN